MQQVQKSVCRLLPTHFPIFPCSLGTILNLEPTVRTYYSTLYSFVIFSEVSASRLKTTRVCRKLWKISLVADYKEKGQTERWALRHQCIKNKLMFSFPPQIMFYFIGLLYKSTEQNPFTKLVSWEEQVTFHPSLVIWFGKRDSNSRCSSGASVSLRGPLMDWEHLSAWKLNFRLVVFVLNGY